MPRNEEYLERFNGKENVPAKKKEWEGYLKRTKVRGVSMWSIGYRIRIQYKSNNQYWVYIVAPKG